MSFSSQKQYYIGFLLACAILLLGFLRLEDIPPLWWDEGWTLQIARNWVEDGFYGRYNNGDQISAGLAAHFPVVASAALSFKVFGVGVWQGRAPSVIYMLLTLTLLFYLVQNLYNKSIAVGTLVVLFLTIPGVNHPIFRGREILGEPAAIFWLIAGYTFLWITLRKSNCFMLLTITAWGIAINAKAQVLPFWVVSLMAAIGYALLKRWWRSAILILISGLGAWVFSKGLFKLQAWILYGITEPNRDPLQNYYSFTALVLDWNVRERALIIAATFGLLTLAGLLYAIWRQHQSLKNNPSVPENALIITALFSLTFSWLAWYLLFSNAWFRYFYPPLFFGSIFAAVFLYEITNNFSWKRTLENYRQKSTSWKTILLPFVTVWIIISSFLTVSNLAFTFFNNEENCLDVARYANENIAQDALIETYESDMLFLLPEHRFHYPADQVHVDIETHTLYGNTKPFGYNPLIADPDYLILGPYNEKHNLYDQAIIEGSFSLIAEFPGYQIYKRIR